MLDWLIVGGGLHGTYLSLYLTRRKNVPAERLRVLDPYAQPLALWNHYATNSGMEFLRSSHAHNLHFDPFSLVTFARTQAGLPLARFIEPYGRPSLELFRAHCQTLIERYRLDQLRFIGNAIGLSRLNDGWRVESDQGSLEARRVILAIGSAMPHWPEWAQLLQAEDAPIQHIFDPAFERSALPHEAATVVVGGGLTAVQTALALALEYPGHVTLLMRHPLRLHQFDADTIWVSDLADFQAETDYTRRRAIIHQARHRGSMPSDVAAELRKAVEHGLLRLQQDEVAAARYVPSMAKTIELLLKSRATLSAEQVILATGFDTVRPGGAWLEQAILEYTFPLASDGYPIPDQTLCWSPRLYVSGALAELEVGPVARNIIGVKLAAERIGAAL
jgi:glycine/D-amino acid oxidase-like deaminating enzyme